MICKACGKELARGEGIKSTDKKRYCSQSCYDSYNKMWELVFQFVNDSPALKKESKSWGIDFQKICFYLQDNMERIESAMNKNFNSSYGKIRYFSAIIKNGLAEYEMPKPDIIKKTDLEFYEPKYKQKKRRKCLADYEKECQE